MKYLPFENYFIQECLAQGWKWSSLWYIGDFENVYTMIKTQNKDWAKTKWKQKS